MSRVAQFQTSDNEERHGRGLNRIAAESGARSLAAGSSPPRCTHHNFSLRSASTSRGERYRCAISHARERRNALHSQRASVAALVHASRFRKRERRDSARSRRGKTKRGPIGGACRVRSRSRSEARRTMDPTATQQVTASAARRRS